MGEDSQDRADGREGVLLLAAADEAHRRAVKERLSRPPGRGPGGKAGRRPGFRVVTASTGRAALRRAPGATIAAVDLAIPGGPGLETIREMREAHPRLAILAYARASSPSDAVASVMAGADYFHDCGDESGTGLEGAVELAVDRRRLAYSIEKNDAEAEAARRRLAELSLELVARVPGLQPLHSRADVLPFRDAARRYLVGAARLFAGDARGLAGALGVSSFSLRRLFARYEVALPAARRVNRGHSRSR